MKRLTVLLSLSALMVLSASALVLSPSAAVLAEDAPAAASKVKVLVLTGGHGFDQKNFPKTFDRFSDLEITRLDIKADMAFLDDISTFAYDAIVLYNMTQKITPKQQENFIALAEKGVGLIPWHHNLGSFQDWPEYQKIAGAKYVMAKGGSGYKHDVDMKLHIVQEPRHEIVAPLGDFTVRDETYIRQAFEKTNQVLVTCDDPTSDKDVVWVRTYRRSRVCTIQPGHGPQAYLDKNFQDLMHRAILWVAKRPLPEGGAKGPAGRAGLLAATTLGAGSFDEVIKGVAGYQFGQSRQVLRDADAAVLAAKAEERPAIRKALVGLLHAQAGVEAKRWALTQLALIGTPAEVPALAEVLGDKDLHVHARQALEAVPGEEASAALRAALDKLTGEMLVGVINSLGVRGDCGAADKVLALVKSQDLAVSRAATAAAGKLCPSQPEALMEAVKRAELTGEASDSLLRIADRLVAAGKAADAEKIYQAVLALPQPHVVSAGLAGLLRSSPQAGRETLSGYLTSEAAAKRTAALAVLGQLPADQASALFEEQLPKASPAVAMTMLGVLGSRKGVQAPKALAALTQSSEAGVRLGAIQAAGRAGDESLVPALLKACGADEPALAQAGKASLLELAGAKVNAAIVEAMKAAPPALRVELIRVLVARNAGEAGSALLEETKHADPAVRAEAVAALGKLTDEKALPAMVKLLAGAEDEKVREAAARAVEALASRIADPDRRSAPVVEAYASASPAGKTALLKTAARLGGPKALEMVRGAVKDADPATQEAGIRSLAEWPDASAAGDLLAIAKTSDKEVFRVLALRAYLRVAALPAERTGDQTAQMYADALAAARRAEDKKLVLAALAGTAHPKALDLAVTCASDAELTREASATAFTLAEALFSVNSQAVQAAMQKLAGSSDAAVAARAKDFVEQATKGVRLAANIARLGKASSPDGVDKDGASGGDEAAIDGNPATYWDEDDGKPLYRLVVTFEQAQAVNAISVLAYAQHNYAPKDFEVLIDGKSVKAVKDAQYEDCLLLVSFPQTTGKAVELKITGCYGASAGIRELGIYGPQETRVPELQMKNMLRRQLESGAFIAVPKITK